MKRCSAKDEEIGGIKSVYIVSTNEYNATNIEDILNGIKEAHENIYKMPKLSGGSEIGRWYPQTLIWTFGDKQ